MAKLTIGSQTADAGISDFEKKMTELPSDAKVPRVRFYKQKPIRQRGVVDSFNELIGVFTGVGDHDTMVRLFHEMFTEKELSDITLRWKLLKDLHRGDTQRTIALKHKISLCKITRGSKLLKDPQSVIGRLLRETLGEKTEPRSQRKPSF